MRVLADKLEAQGPGVPLAVSATTVVVRVAHACACAVCVPYTWVALRRETWPGCRHVCVCVCGAALQTPYNSPLGFIAAEGFVARQLAEGEGPPAHQGHPDNMPSCLASTHEL